MAEEIGEPKLQALEDTTLDQKEEQIQQAEGSNVNENQGKNDRKKNKKHPNPNQGRKEPKKPRLLIDKHDSLDTETEYYFENGLRKVKPYPYEYLSYAKGRWIGKRIIEVFEKEFCDASVEYYEKAIQEGRVTINQTKVTRDTVIVNGDLIGHLLYRHEPPVSADPIEIIAETDDLLVVNKPGSIPVHPSGRYRHNTVTTILRKEFNFSNLFTIHRLDRLTSGILMFAKTKGKTVLFQKQLMEKELEKEYVCRVLGKFPEGEIVCEEPIAVISFKLGLNAVSPDGKQSKTLFNLMSYNGRTSAVKCRPITGRTHQIRVHLQFLGYPIVNDPLYCHPFFGSKLGKGGLEKEEIENIVKQFESILEKDDPMTPSSSTNEKEKIEGNAEREEENNTNSKGKEKEENGKELADDTGKGKMVESKQEKVLTVQLTEEKMAVFQKEPALLVEHKPNKKDPLKHELGLWLHAFRYSGPDFTYETKLPEWAQPDFDDSELIKIIKPKITTNPHGEDND